MTMLKHFLLRLYRRQLPLLAMTVNMAELKHAQFVRQLILPGCKSGITGTAYKALSQSLPKEKSVTRLLRKHAILSVVLMRMIRSD